MLQEKNGNKKINGIISEMIRGTPGSGCIPEAWSNWWSIPASSSASNYQAGA